MEEELILKERKVYVPKDEELRTEIIQLHHNMPVAGHCYIQVHSSGNYISTVESPPKHTSLPSTVATFLVTCLMAVLQPSRYSIVHSEDTSIQLGLP